MGLKTDDIIVEVNGGWQTAESFYNYALYLIEMWKYRPKPIIWVVDGHNSHKSPQLEKLCAENNIFLLVLYPYSTHILQALDIAWFHPMKTEIWRQRKILINQRRVADNLGEFGKPFLKILDGVNIFLAAHEKLKATKTIAIVNGFRAGGLVPLNPEAISLKSKSKLIDLDAPDLLARNDKVMEMQYGFNSIAEIKKNLENLTNFLKDVSAVQFALQIINSSVSELDSVLKKITKSEKITPTQQQTIAMLTFEKTTNDELEENKSVCSSNCEDDINLCISIDRKSIKELPFEPRDISEPCCSKSLTPQPPKYIPKRKIGFINAEKIFDQRKKVKNNDDLSSESECENEKSCEDDSSINSSISQAEGENLDCLNYLAEETTHPVGYLNCSHLSNKELER